MSNTILIKGSSERDCVPERVFDGQNQSWSKQLPGADPLVGWDLASASYGQ